MTIVNHTSQQSLLVTDLSRKGLILGMSFLKEYNPEVNWKELKIEFSRCPNRCAPAYIAVQDEDLENIKIPHMEDMMEFIDSQELDHNWNGMDSFIRWISLSEDPEA